MKNREEEVERRRKKNNKKRRSSRGLLSTEKRKRKRKSERDKGHVASCEWLGGISFYLKPPTTINYSRTPSKFISIFCQLIFNPIFNLITLYPYTYLIVP